VKKENLEKIKEFLKDGNFDSALEIAREESKGKEDESAKALINVGIKEGKKYEIENCRLALLYFKLANSIAKDDEIKKNARENRVITHYNLGALLAKQKDREKEAEEEYRKAIDITPEYVGAHGNLGNLLKSLKRYEEAEEEYQEVILINPNDAKAHYNLGILLYDLKRYEEAEEEYRKAIKLKEFLPDKGVNAHNNLGFLLSEQKGRENEAEKDYREAIRINSDFAVGHYNLGVLLANLKRYEEAEKEYREAIRINSSYAEARNNLGSLLYDLKRYDEAEKEYEKAIELLDKDSPEVCAIVHSNLGELYLSFGDMLHEDDFYEDALDEFKEALENSSKLDKNADLHNNMGYAFEKLKRFDDARIEFRKSRKLNPRDTKVKRNLRRIEKPIKEKQDMSKTQTALFYVVSSVLCLAIYSSSLNQNSPNFVHYAGFIVVLLALLIVLTVLPSLTRLKIPGLEFEKDARDRTTDSEVIPTMEGSAEGYVSGEI